MDLRQLRQFIAVAEERSFRKAAQRLHLSQPPLSVAIQRLEEELGTPLLDRSRHHVELTVAGATFLREARQVLAQTQRAIELTQRSAQGQVGELALSFVPSAAVGVVPRLLRQFRQAYPEVKLSLAGETTSQQVARIAQGATDIGILVPPLHGADSIRVESFAEQEFVLAVPADHSLASHRSCRLADVAGEPFVGFPMQEGPGFGAAVLAVCQSCGFIPNVVQVAPQIHTILVLVAGGVGVSLVPHALRSIAMENVAYVKVHHQRMPVTYSIGMAYRSDNRNPALQSFLACARRARRTGAHRF